MVTYVGSKGSFVHDKATAYRWFLLPYGVYICKDGREVLFNREYAPIWERKDGIIKKANLKEWIEDIIEIKNFYKDGTYNKRQCGINKMAEWGIAIPHVSELKSMKEGK